MYPPQKYSKTPRFGNLRKIRWPFFDLNYEKWKLQISQQIARNPLNSPPTTMNHAKSARLSLNPTTPCSLTVPQPFFFFFFLQQISQNSPNSLILRANHTKLTNFALISTNLLFYFRHP